MPPNLPPQPPPPADPYSYGPLLPYDAQPPGHRRHRLLIFLRKYWWVPLITAVLALGAGFAYARFMPPVYVSTASMWVTGKLRVLESTFFTEESQNYFGTQIGLLQSDHLRQLALDRLRSSSTNQLPTDPEGRPLPIKIKPAQVPKSTVVKIEATGAVPGYTQAYLEALMAAFLEYKREVRAQASGDTLTSLHEQISRQEQELKTEQEKIIEFRRANTLALLEEQGKLAGSYLAGLTGQLADYKLQSQLLEAAALEGKAPAGTNASARVPDTLAGTNAVFTAGAPIEFQAARKQLDLLKIQREQLSQYLRPKHPKIVKLTDEIERGEKLVNVMRDQDREQLAASRQAVKLKIETVTASIREWEAKLTEANSRLAEFERLKQNVDRMQSLRDRLLPLVQSIDVNRNIDQEAVSILEHASPGMEDRPMLPVVLALAVLIGLGVGVGLIFLVELADDRLMSTEEVARQFTEELIGQLPEVQRNGKHPRPILLEPDDPRHVFAESCRNLRSSLLFGQKPEGQPKTLLVTSALPEEGKTTVAVNLARTLAFGGARVLLVDADLRRSVIHRLFKIEREPGLGNLLEDQADPDRFNFIRPSSTPNLYVIPSGKPANNCGELLLSKTFARLLEVARREFDYVIFDTIPVFASDDATTLAPKVDGVLLVIRSGYSRSRLVHQALELLYQRQAKVLGLVFNRADTRSSHYPYYRYAKYYEKAGQAKEPSPEESGNGKPEPNMGVERIVIRSILKK